MHRPHDVQTAFAGYPNMTLAVRRKDGSLQGINVDPEIPGPPGGLSLMPSTTGLRVEVHGSPILLVWRDDGKTVATTQVTSVADLAGAVHAQWTAHGAHRAADDRVLDQAAVFLGDDLEYGTLVAVVDAILATTREYPVAGKTQQAAAIEVTLTMPREIPAARR